jgi:hypothetical protein
LNIAVRLYTAAASKRVRFHWIDARTGQRVQQQLISPSLAAEAEEGAETKPLAEQRSFWWYGRKRMKIRRAQPLSGRMSFGKAVAPQDYVQLTADELPDTSVTEEDFRREPKCEKCNVPLVEAWRIPDSPPDVR